MRILMTNNALTGRGGSESYLETVSFELRRLGHEVIFYAPGCGDVAAALRADGFDVFEAVEDLPRDLDVIHGQHVNAVGMVRTRFPSVPLVFATHSWFISALEDPVPELGAAAFVAFNDITRSRLAAHVATQGAVIHRLTQPVAISHADANRVRIGSTPLRAVAVSRRMSRLPSQLATICADRGLAFEWVGAPERTSADPREEMLAADIVVAMGRTALEAMAAGRAVLVADESTNGGWITGGTYPGLERDGFTGYLAEGVVGGFEAMLGHYSSDMGTEARTFAVKNHSAQQHAVRLVEIYASVADTAVDVRSPQTVSRLADESYGLERRALRAEWAGAARRRELDVVAAELAAVRRERDRAQAETAAVKASRTELRRRNKRLRRERDEARRSLAQLEQHALVRGARRTKRALARVALSRHRSRP